MTKFFANCSPPLALYSDDIPICLNCYHSNDATAPGTVQIYIGDTPTDCSFSCSPCNNPFSLEAMNTFSSTVISESEKEGGDAISSNASSCALEPTRKLIRFEFSSGTAVIRLLRVTGVELGR